MAINRPSTVIYLPGLTNLNPGPANYKTDWIRHLGKSKDGKRSGETNIIEQNESEAITETDPLYLEMEKENSQPLEILESFLHKKILKNVNLTNLEKKQFNDALHFCADRMHQGGFLSPTGSALFKILQGQPGSPINLAIKFRKVDFTPTNFGFYVSTEETFSVKNLALNKQGNIKVSGKLKVDVTKIPPEITQVGNCNLTNINIPPEMLADLIDKLSYQIKYSEPVASSSELDEKDQKTIYDLCFGQLGDEVTIPAELQSKMQKAVHRIINPILTNLKLSHEKLKIEFKKGENDTALTSEVTLPNETKIAIKFDAEKVFASFSPPNDSPFIHPFYPYILEASGAIDEIDLIKIPPTPTEKELNKLNRKLKELFKSLEDLCTQKKLSPQDRNIILAHNFTSKLKQQHIETLDYIRQLTPWIMDGYPVKHPNPNPYEGLAPTINEFLLKKETTLIDLKQTPYKDISLVFTGELKSLLQPLKNREKLLNDESYDEKNHLQIAKGYVLDLLRIPENAYSKIHFTDDDYNALDKVIKLIEKDLQQLEKESSKESKTNDIQQKLALSRQAKERLDKFALHLQADLHKQAMPFLKLHHDLMTLNAKISLSKLNETELSNLRSKRSNLINERDRIYNEIPVKTPEEINNAKQLNKNIIQALANDLHNLLDNIPQPPPPPSENQIYKLAVICGELQFSLGYDYKLEALLEKDDSQAVVNDLHKQLNKHISFNSTQLQKFEYIKLTQAWCNFPWQNAEEGSALSLFLLDKKSKDFSKSEFRSRISLKKNEDIHLIMQDVKRSLEILLKADNEYERHVDDSSYNEQEKNQRENNRFNAARSFTVSLMQIPNDHLQKSLQPSSIYLPLLKKSIAILNEDILYHTTEIAQLRETLLTPEKKHLHKGSEARLANKDAILKLSVDAKQHLHQVAFTLTTPAKQTVLTKAASPTTFIAGIGATIAGTILTATGVGAIVGFPLMVGGMTLAGVGFAGMNQNLRSAEANVRQRALMPPKKPSYWKRALQFTCGVLLIAAGAVLTATGVGAIIGIPAAVAGFSVAGGAFAVGGYLAADAGINIYRDRRRYNRQQAELARYDQEYLALEKNLMKAGEKKKTSSPHGSTADIANEISHGDAATLTPSVQPPTPHPSSAPSKSPMPSPSSRSPKTH